MAWEIRANLGPHVRGGVDARGWLWENGQTHDLNDLIDPDSLYHIYRAYAINESGQIASGASPRIE